MTLREQMVAIIEQEPDTTVAANRILLLPQIVTWAHAWWKANEPTNEDLTAARERIDGDPALQAAITTLNEPATDAAPGAVREEEG